MANNPKAEFSWPEIGNNRIIDFLERAINNGKIAQTYIFIGPDDLGKSTVAMAFAKNLQGENGGFNSDLHILERAPEEKGISIAAVREFIKVLNLSSFSNSYKIGVIKEADLLSEEAKSALLKTLEEPKENVIIILLAKDENSLPATILSRGQLLYFQPVPSALIYDYLIKHFGANRSLAKDLSKLALGKPLAAVKLFEDQQAYKNCLEQAELWLSIFGTDVNNRLSVLDKLFNDRTWSRQALGGADGILSMAEGLSRDLLLLFLDQKDRLQYSAISEALERTIEVLGGNDNQKKPAIILNQLKLIAQAREYLGANVNPRLVLEQLIVNI